jgi:HrpA-like RNA helicase
MGAGTTAFDLILLQLPELLRTPLQELCLQIKSLGLGKIRPFLENALQPPDPQAVQNAIELLETIGALDEDENLTSLGKHRVLNVGLRKGLAREIAVPGQLRSLSESRVNAPELGGTPQPPQAVQRREC